MRIILLLSFLCVTFTYSYARTGNYDVKGLKLYTQFCKKCHGNPYKGAAMLRSYEWEKLFAKSAKKLKKLHIKEDIEKELFTKKLTKKRIIHLRQFLMESASDMGITPSCDGNFC